VGVGNNYEQEEGNLWRKDLSKVDHLETRGQQTAPPNLSSISNKFQASHLARSE
jgi:hypothetical protein